MQIEVFDVGHGHCSVMTAPNGTRLMLDCGTRWDDERFWTPSLHYVLQSVPVLALLNLDEDHIADFGSMVEDCGVQIVLTNPTIGPDQFKRLKSAGMGPGAQAYLNWLSTAGPVSLPAMVDYGPVQIRSYRNAYGPQYTTTNDLSLAVVLQYGGFKILFGGDLEKSGWSGLLAQPAFVAELAGVTVFVASHHGRFNGCHDKVFSFMNPQVVVISDGEKQYDTQETDAWYRQRCQGVPLIARPQERRYVLTTRNDGAMRFTVEPDGAWQVTWGIKVKDWPRQDSPSKGLADIPWNALLGGTFGLPVQPQPNSTGLPRQKPWDALYGDPLDLAGLGLINRR